MRLSSATAMGYTMMSYSSLCSWDWMSYCLFSFFLVFYRIFLVDNGFVYVEWSGGWPGGGGGKKILVSWLLLLLFFHAGI